MSFRPARLWIPGGVALLAALALPARAVADEPAAPEAALAAPPEDEEHAGKARLPAPDEIGGHLFGGASLGWLAPAGSFARLRPARSLTSAGPSFAVSAGYGLGRSAVLEATGAYASLGAPSSCSACSGRSYALGVGLVYHLTQAFAIDPWVGYGVAYRRASFEVADSSASGGLRTDAYGGVDIARLSLGADYYPAPTMGFGPFLEADFGASIARPDPDPGGSSYALFQIGLRFAWRPGRAPLGAGGAKSALR